MSVMELASAAPAAETGKGVRSVRMIDAEKLKDVLENVKNHLEAYPNILANYKECVMSLIDIVNAQPTITPPPNDPLTLEQLREMDGEPVWVERTRDDFRTDSAWAFVDCCHRSCRGADGNPTYFDFYGKTWLAYRRKLEGDEHEQQKRALDQAHLPNALPASEAAGGGVSDHRAAAGEGRRVGPGAGGAGGT